MTKMTLIVLFLFSPTLFAGELIAPRLSVCSSNKECINIQAQNGYMEHNKQILHLFNAKISAEKTEIANRVRVHLVKKFMAIQNGKSTRYYKFL